MLLLRLLLQGHNSSHVQPQQKWQAPSAGDRRHRSSQGQVAPQPGSSTGGTGVQQQQQQPTCPAWLFSAPAAAARTCSRTPTATGTTDSAGMQEQQQHCLSPSITLQTVLLSTSAGCQGSLTRNAHTHCAPLCTHTRRSAVPRTRTCALYCVLTAAGACLPPR